ncbi:MAG: hypothetical protein E6021_13250 [Staphylococcus epidermidis]|nr:hypothetical protein [Staphylococcus epidermidis]
MTNIIAMHSSKVLREAKHHSNGYLMLIHSVYVTAFIDTIEGSETTAYSIYTDCQHNDQDERPCVMHFVDGCNFGYDLAETMKNYNEFVKTIKSNEEYFLNRSIQLENDIAYEWG